VGLPGAGALAVAAEASAGHLDGDVMAPEILELDRPLAGGRLGVGPEGHELDRHAGRRAAVGAGVAVTGAVVDAARVVAAARRARERSDPCRYGALPDHPAADRCNHDTTPPPPDARDPAGSAPRPGRHLRKVRT